MELLFDGTIHSGDHRAGGYGPGGSGSTPGYGSYTGWYCIPQIDSLTTVPAPGGRLGYAVKIIARPIVSACGSLNKDQHVQISTTIIGMPTTHKEAWIGWSTMLDPSWQPQGPGGWEHFGMGFAMLGYVLPNTGLYTDISEYDTSIHVLNNARHSDGRNVLSAAEHTKGVWHDWMFHVKWAKDNTGFVELWHKTGTNPYKMVFWHYNVATLNPANPDRDFVVRLGLYRSEVSISTQIFWTQGVKIGLTRADVEYGGPAECPALTCNLTIGGGAQIIEYKNIQGTIEASNAPTSAPFTVILKTTPTTISNTLWAILLRRSGSWAVECSPGIYKDGEVKSGKLIFEITDKQDLFSSIDMRILVGQQVHLAIVFTATNCKFYLNGVLKSDIVHTAQPGTGGTVYTNEPYLGFTEYARIWDKALTQTEIHADMTQT